MSLQLGLVGLPNVGKSTLFNALTQAGAQVAPYPFTTIDPNVGIVPVADPRLDRLAAIVQPEKVTPTTLRVVDIAGLVRGASRGEGLGNQFLSHVRGVDAIAMVVRCFLDPDIPHVTTALSPADDIATIAVEMALSDLAVLERHIERVRAQAKSHPRDYADQIEVLESVQDALGRGIAIRQQDIPKEQLPWVREVDLLTGKPIFYVANVSERDLPDGGPLAAAVRARAAEDQVRVLVVCAALEAEIGTWPCAEAAEYRRALGVSQAGLRSFIAVGYALLDLITFFTVTGGKEVRAWTLRRGATALDAAATIHSDLARGFIRAEVVAYDDLDAAGSWARARDRGALRLEGRDYVVRDGDVLHIRFNV